MSEQPNLNYIKQLAGDSLSFEQKLIGIIKLEFPQEKTEFMNNYKAKENKKAAENVHKLKHKIGMLGLEQGYQVAIDFEEALLNNNTLLYPNFLQILDQIDNFLTTL